MMTLMPTSELRWLRVAVPPVAYGDQEYHLQQWWANVNAEGGEWRDVPVHDPRGQPAADAGVSPD